MRCVRIAHIHTASNELRLSVEYCRRQSNFGCAAISISEYSNVQMKDKIKPQMWKIIHYYGIIYLQFSYLSVFPVFHSHLIMMMLSCWAKHLRTHALHTHRHKPPREHTQLFQNTQSLVSLMMVSCNNFHRIFEHIELVTAAVKFLENFFRN